VKTSALPILPYQQVLEKPPKAAGTRLPQVFVAILAGTEEVPVPTIAAAPLNESSPTRPVFAPVIKTQFGVADNDSKQAPA
jgi:hypothetical protein